MGRGLGLQGPLRLHPKNYTVFMVGATNDGFGLPTLTIYRPSCRFSPSLTMSSSLTIVLSNISSRCLILAGHSSIRWLLVSTVAILHFWHNGDSSLPIRERSFPKFPIPVMASVTILVSDLFSRRKCLVWVAFNLGVILSFPYIPPSYANFVPLSHCSNPSLSPSSNSKKLG